MSLLTVVLFLWTLVVVDNLRKGFAARERMTSLSLLSSRECISKLMIPAEKILFLYLMYANLIRER